MGPGNMSHCETPSFNDHLDQWLRDPQTHTTKLLEAKTVRLSEHNQCYSAHWSSLEILDSCQMKTGRFGLSEVCVMFPKTEIIRSHKTRAGTHPISVQCPTR